MNRTLVWHLALRYVRGKRSANVVPILSRISMVAIAVGSGAMIILFSVFNGFASLVKDLYVAFYPQVKVSVVKGKFFSLDNAQLNSIKHLPGVQNIAIVIEDNVLASSDPNEQIVTIKGIDSNYFRVNTARSYINQGRDSVSIYPLPTAIVGQHIANTLGLDVDNAFSKLTLYYLNNSSVSSAVDIASATKSLILKPDGTFRVNDEFDSKFVLAPLSLVQDFFNQSGKYSSIELKLNNEVSANKVKSELQGLLGSAYKVQTRYEQNETIYSVMSTEKWVVYAVLVLVLIIASFNMVGALSLLVLEKRRDMTMLKAMGAQPATIRTIFILEGILWALLGGAIGILLGAIICMGQQHFKWIKMTGSFIVDAYPIKMLPTDFLLVIATIIIVGLLASLYPAIRATRVDDPTLKST